MTATVKPSEKEIRPEDTEKVVDVGPFKKIQIMTSTVAIYVKGFIHSREAVEEPVYSNVKSFEDSFEHILAPSPTEVGKKKRLRVDGFEEEKLS